MKIIDVAAENIDWPAECCRCGSKKFDIKEHTEKVVLWTTLSRYKISTSFLEYPGVCWMRFCTHKVVWRSHSIRWNWRRWLVPIA